MTASGSGGIPSPSLGSGGLGSGGVPGIGASWGGDGISPPGRGGSLGAGGVPDGSAGTGGVDPNCFMRCGQGNAIHYTGGAGGTAGTASTGAGGAGGAADARSGVDAVDCQAKNQLYNTAVAAAGQCDPTAAAPCASYQGVNCPPVGVNPDSVTALSAQLAALDASGCGLRATSCPIFLIKPAPYTCQAGADGVYRCYSVCENMAGGRASCVSQSAGCSGVTLTSGYCASPSTVCCSP